MGTEHYYKIDVCQCGDKTLKDFPELIARFLEKEPRFWIDKDFLSYSTKWLVSIDFMAISCEFPDITLRISIESTDKDERLQVQWFRNGEYREWIAPLVEPPVVPEEAWKRSLPGSELN